MKSSLVLILIVVSESFAINLSLKCERNFCTFEDNENSVIAKNANHDDCKITSFSPSNFTSRHLTITNYQICEKVPKKLTDFVPNLENLRITKTSLTTIDRSGFAGLTKLRHLLLDSNQIDWIFPDAFNDLPNLESLFLSNNKIEIFHSNLLAKNLELKSLWADYNRIEQLEVNVFEKNTKMEWISFTHNRIFKIEVKFDQFRSLKHVNLERNLKKCDLKYNFGNQTLSDFQEMVNALCK